MSLNKLAWINNIIIGVVIRTGDDTVIGEIAKITTSTQQRRTSLEVTN